MTEGLKITPNIALAKRFKKVLLSLHSKTTPGHWKIRHFPDGKDLFIEVPEPKERGFGYDIEIFGEDDNGYPTRENDFEFVEACHDLLPKFFELAKTEAEKDDVVKTLRNLRETVKNPDVRKALDKAIALINIFLW